MLSPPAGMLQVEQVFVFYGHSIPLLSFFLISHKEMGFTGGSVVNNPPANSKATGDAVDPWVRKIP